MTVETFICLCMIFGLTYLLEWTRFGTTVALMAATVFWYINFGVRM